MRVSLTYDPGPKVVRDAINDPDFCFNREHIDHLKRGLKAHDWLCRYVSVRAFIKLGAAAAGAWGDLLSVARDGSEMDATRAAAIDAIGSIGEAVRHLLPTLEQFTTDSSDCIRQSAFAAVDKIRTIDQRIKDQEANFRRIKEKFAVTVDSPGVIFNPVPGDADFSLTWQMVFDAVMDTWGDGSGCIFAKNIADSVIENLKQMEPASIKTDKQIKSFQARQKRKQAKEKAAARSKSKKNKKPKRKKAMKS